MEEDARNPATPEEKTVLIVEDDADIRDAVAELLSLEGYRVLTAPNGQEALGMLGGLSHPCLVLLDLRMPVMDGHALLDVMRRVRDFHDLPVVVMTAEHGPRLRDAASQAEDVLSKPFKVDRLLETVEHCCH